MKGEEESDGAHRTGTAHVSRWAGGVGDGNEG